MMGLGCAGAVPALQRAVDFVRANPARRALVLAVEICSACYFVDRTPETVIETPFVPMAPLRSYSRPKIRLISVIRKSSTSKLFLILRRSTKLDWTAGMTSCALYLALPFSILPVP